MLIAWDACFSHEIVSLHTVLLAVLLCTVHTKYMLFNLCVLIVNDDSSSSYYNC